MKIVVDGFGGDYAPKEVVEGCIKALNNNPKLNLVIAGDKDQITKQLQESMFASDRLDIIHATDVISNNESPALAVRRKTKSSIVVAYDYLKENDDAVGLVSAGSTGATLAGAILKLGRIQGVSRPALAPLLPTLAGNPVMLLDVGANVDCKAINLLHFALMANEYMKSIGIKEPKVALLNVGTEDEKGNEMVKEAFELLKNESSIKFVGNIEAREVLKGNVDIVVTDGFAGNVCLKTVEGTVELLMTLIKNEIKASAWSKICYAMGLKKPFKNVKAKMDYKKYGGAPLLGVSKVVIKCHGNSKSDNIASAIEQVLNLHKSKMIDNISKAVEKDEE